MVCQQFHSVFSRQTTQIKLLYLAWVFCLSDWFKLVKGLYLEGNLIQVSAVKLHANKKSLLHRHEAKNRHWNIRISWIILSKSSVAWTPGGFLSYATIYNSIMFFLGFGQQPQDQQSSLSGRILKTCSILIHILILFTFLFNFY